jgi:hypothetical protein
VLAQLQNSGFGSKSQCVRDKLGLFYGEFYKQRNAIGKLSRVLTLLERIKIIWQINLKLNKNILVCENLDRE